MRIAMVMSEWACARPIPTNDIFGSPRGLTGSEISFLMMARGLKKMGHDVSIFTNFTSSEVVYDIPHLEIGRFSAAMNENWDGVAAWIDPNPLQLVKPGTKRLLNQQVNDFHYCPGWEGYVDVITSPSLSHKNYIKSQTNFAGRWEVLPNGADTSVYSLKNRKSNTKKSLVYASSPDRGLHWLLEAFPAIKKRVPEATLDVFYDWQAFYNNVKGGNSETSFRLRYCKEMFDRLTSHGVRHHGSASRAKMIDVFSESRILAYPCDTVSYTEGFSVTTLEAALMGCVPVIVDTDALGEVYRGYVPVIDGPYRDHKQEYVDTVVSLLKDDITYESWQAKSAALSSLYSWEFLSKFLVELLSS